MPTSAEITARLNGDSSGFRSAMNQAELAAKESGSKLKKHLDLKDAVGVMAAAIGLNIQDISENFARMFASVSKEAEKSFEELEAITERVSKLQTELNEQRLNEEQKRQRQLAKIADDERVIVSLQKKGADELGFWQKALISFGISSGQIGQAWTTMYLKQKSITEEAKKNVEIGKVKEDQLTRQNALVKEEYADKLKHIQLVLDERAKALKYAEENREMLTLEARGVNNLNLEERVRLDVLRLQNKEKTNQIEIDRLLATPVGERTKNDKKKLDHLLEENKNIDVQIGLKKDLVEQTKKQASSEGEVADAIGFATNKLASYIDQWTGFVMEVKSFGKGDKDLSDRELERKLANIKADIAKRQYDLNNQTGLAGSSPYDAFLEAQKSNLSQLQNEINLRNDVRSKASLFGESAAFDMFGGISESRFREILGSASEQEKQTKILEDIRDQQRRGIVTVNMGSMGG